MRRLAILSALTGTLALAALAAPDARACWDGSLAAVGRVTVRSGDTAYTPERGREQARWLARIDRLLAAYDATLEVEFGSAALTIGERYVTWETSDDLERLFVRTARALRARPAAIQNALGAADPTIYTVQVGSFATREQAEALESELDELAPVEQGFFEAGGFPAVNGPAFVAATELDGHVFYRVYVGMYLDRAEAEAAREALANDADRAAVPGFARALPD